MARHKRLVNPNTLKPLPRSTRHCVTLKSSAAETKPPEFAQAKEYPTADFGVVAYSSSKFSIQR